MNLSSRLLALLVLGTGACVTHAAGPQSECPTPKPPSGQHRSLDDARRSAEQRAITEREEREREQRLQSPRFHRGLRVPDPDSSHLRDGLLLEEQGRGEEAVRVYKRAANAGDAKAALRLALIYKSGIPGVPADCDAALRWYKAARALEQ